MRWIFADMSLDKEMLQVSSAPNRADMTKSTSRRDAQDPTSLHRIAYRSSNGYHFDVLQRPRRSADRWLATSSRLGRATFWCL